MAGRWWRRGALALLAAAGLSAGLWFAAAAGLEARFAAWAEARRAEGWRVEHAAPRRAGYPFAAELRIPALRIETPAGIGWEAERAALRLALTAPALLRARLEGSQGLRGPGGVAPVEAAGLGLDVPLAGGPARLAAQRLVAPGLSLEALSGTVGSGRLELGAERVTLGALPPLPGASLAVRIAPLPEGSAAAWRAAGGRLEIEGLELRQGTAALRLSGRLGLDAALQPEGQASLLVTDPPAALAWLAEGGWLAPGLAAGLRAMAMLAARPDPAGGPPRLDLPLELRDRRLAAARLPLLTLPPIDWR